MSQTQKTESENYRVVFVGLVDSSDDKTQAFAKELSTTFRIPLEKALQVVEKAPIVIKKGISRSKAERYQQFFVKIGGQVRIEEGETSVQAAPAPAKAAKAEGLETTTIESQKPAAHPPTPEPQEQKLPETGTRAEGYDREIADAYEEGFSPPSPGDAPKPESGSLFQCPQCGQNQERGIECIKCGIIFEKYERMAQEVSQMEVQTEETPSMEDPAPPLEPTEQDVQVEIEPAGFWVRVAAAFVDNLVFNLVCGFLAAALFFFLGGVRNPAAIASMSPLAYPVLLFLFFGYHIYFLGSRGYTPGKGFLGLQVIRQDGTGMSYGDAAVRTFSTILSSIPLCLGYLWVGIDKNKQGWHDKIAKTQVIKAETVSAWRKWVVLVPALLIPVLGVVAAVGVPMYGGYASRADVAKAVAEMQVVKSQLEEHFYRYNRYPLTGEFPTFLRHSLGRVPVDPFNHGRPYRYESNGAAFTLWSIGPDRIDNGAQIPYDPYLKRGFKQEGDIVLHSDEGTDQSGELFGMAPEETDPWMNFSD
jgi:uncharacterized RDD family membrane protein YckC